MSFLPDVGSPDVLAHQASLKAEATWAPPVGEHRTILVDSEQLHGRACVVCGSTMDGLMDAGHLYVQPGGWRAKACPHHTNPTGAAA